MQVVIINYYLRSNRLNTPAINIIGRAEISKSGLPRTSDEPGEKKSVLQNSTRRPKNLFLGKPKKVSDSTDILLTAAIPKNWGLFFGECTPTIIITLPNWRSAVNAIIRLPWPGIRRPTGCSRVLASGLYDIIRFRLTLETLCWLQHGQGTRVAWGSERRHQHQALSTRGGGRSHHDSRAEAYIAYIIARLPLLMLLRAAADERWTARARLAPAASAALTPPPLHHVIIYIQVLYVALQEKL